MSRPLDPTLNDPDDTLYDLELKRLARLEAADLRRAKRLDANPPPPIDVEAERARIAPTPPPPPPKRGRGKPRRNPNAVAKKIMVRLDVETAEALRQEFGSLGNALYFTAQGLRAFKLKTEAEALAALQSAEAWVGPELQPLPPDPEDTFVRTPTLSDADWFLVQALLQRAADFAPEPDHYRRPPADLDPRSDPRAKRPPSHATPAPTESDRIEAALRRLELTLGRGGKRGAPY